MNIWKKTLAATAAGVLCLGGAGVPGVLNATDVAQILTYVARSAVGMDTTLTDDQLAAADIDDSGEIDSKDAAYFLTYIAQDGAGMEPSWETILGK